ncbi:MAG: Uma2 family endonuclease, partial [Chloroflexi bacterium]|nr:Uma2 family endonuclease [Chloroflexota bacterium]
APADWVPGPPQGQWTYKDYAALPDDGNRYEVLSGVLYMAPSPDRWHQKASGAIFYHLYASVQLAGLGEVYSCPFDVILDAKNTFQPDILVVLNEHLDRITKRGVVGAPDLAVEIASPSTARIDLSEKLSAYASAGVPEYWVVNPDSRTVEVFVLKHGIYNSLGIYYGPAVLPSRIIPNLNVKVEQFFP